MILSSACHLWQPDTAADAAQEHRSYTTRWDTIPKPAVRSSGSGHCLGAPPTRHRVDVRHNVIVNTGSHMPGRCDHAARPSPQAANGSDPRPGTPPSSPQPWRYLPKHHERCRP
jgi:hypothetical protein